MGQTPELVVLPGVAANDPRAPLSPDNAKRLIGNGWRVTVPAGLGAGVGWLDAAYTEAGAEVVPNVTDRLASAAVALTRDPPTHETIDRLGPASVLLGFLEPFERLDLVAALRDKGVSAMALELVPRTTIAQPMDALSSQASLAGYAMVLMAADVLGKALPMMSTAAGTIRPAKVLVVGTGVAGLQAIATAQRLGARVTAYDVRETARQQVESLGAQFAKIDLGGDAETAGGYAKALTEDQLAKQRQQLAALCAQSDVIVCTAQVFGRRAPVIVTHDMLTGMGPGSVVVDGAAATGSNVEGTATHTGDEPRTVGHARVLAPTRPAARVARDASFVLGANVMAILAHVFPSETGEDKTTSVRTDLNTDDAITAAMLATHAGNIPDARLADKLAQHTTGGASA